MVHAKIRVTQCDSLHVIFCVCPLTCPNSQTEKQPCLSEYIYIPIDTVQLYISVNFPRTSFKMSNNILKLVKRLI